MIIKNYKNKYSMWNYSQLVTILTVLVIGMITSFNLSQEKDNNKYT